MTRKLKFFAWASVLSLIFLYLAFSFVKCEINFVLWHWGDRVTFLFDFFACLSLSSAIFYYHDGKSENPS